MVLDSSLSTCATAPKLDNFLLSLPSDGLLFHYDAYQQFHYKKSKKRLMRQDTRGK